MFTQHDRFRLVLLARFTRFWKQALHIVQPDTLLRWHRDLFRFYWRMKSKRKQNKPKIPPETIDLIRKMANENRLWGAERIRGELLKLGIKVCKRTIQKYMPKERKSPSSSQTWATFVKNHIGDIWACDFTVVYDWLFRPWHIFVIMELKTRRIVHSAVTTSPTDEWTAQQLREATPWGQGPKYLLHDRDSKYASHFSAVAAGSGIKELRTPYRAPRANGVCERYMGSLRRECLDHTLILHDRHLTESCQGIYQLLQSGTTSSGNWSTDPRTLRSACVKPNWKYLIQGFPWWITSQLFSGGLSEIICILLNFNIPGDCNIMRNGPN